MTNHDRLVDIMVSQSNTDYPDYTITSDSSNNENRNVRTIGRYRPDMIAESKNNRHIIIGEAKATKDDLFSKHTLEQMSGYEKYIINNKKIGLIDDGEIHLILPKSLMKRAKSYLKKYEIKYLTYEK